MTNKRDLLKRVSLNAVVGAAVLLGGVGLARAEYPDKPVEMTVLFGGSAKSIADVLADGMSKKLSQPVAPVSRKGGGGAVGYTYVQETKPDGYNIVWNSNSISTSFHNGNMKFDYTAFDPVAMVTKEVPALGVRADSGWKSLGDIVKAAKEMNGGLKVGISGKGAFTHLTSAALFGKAGVKVTYVPYGADRGPTELLGGRLDAVLLWPNQFKSHMEAGTVRVLAVTSAERIPFLPDVPTAKEQGVDVDITMWRGVAAPKGTPKAVIAKLEKAVQATVASPEFQDAAKKLGVKTSFMPAAEFGKVIARDDKEIAALMTELEMKKQ